MENLGTTKVIIFGKINDYHSARTYSLPKPTPSLVLRRKWGFAPLCGAAATPVATLKTPVALKGRVKDGKGVGRGEMDGLQY